MNTVPEFVRLAAHPVRWRLLCELAGGDLRVRELVERVGEPQNLVSYHLRLLRAGGVLTASRSSADGRDSYYHLDLDRCATGLAAAGAALHPVLHPSPHPAPAAGTPGPPGGSVLFVCTGNSARSPVAEALLRHRTGGRIAVASAGTRPKATLHPDTVRVLADRFGIDVSAHRPRGLASVARRGFTHVISLCDRAREECPDLPGTPRRSHWSIPEPDSYPAFERAADAIDTRVRHLVPVLAHA